MRKAAETLANGGDPAAAVQQFASAKQFIVECAASRLTSEAATSPSVPSVGLLAYEWRRFDLDFAAARPYMLTDAIQFEIVKPGKSEMARAPVMAAGGIVAGESAGQKPRRCQASQTAH